MNLSSRTYDGWSRQAKQYRNVLRLLNGLNGSIPNDALPLFLSDIRRFMKDVPEADGHALPFQLQRGTGGENINDETNNVILFPSVHSKISLLHLYHKINN